MLCMSLSTYCFCCPSLSIGKQLLRSQLAAHWIGLYWGWNYLMKPTTYPILANSFLDDDSCFPFVKMSPLWPTLSEHRQYSSVLVSRGRMADIDGFLLFCSQCPALHYTTIVDRKVEGGSRLRGTNRFGDRLDLVPQKSLVPWDFCCRCCCYSQPLSEFWSLTRFRAAMLSDKSWSRSFPAISPCSCWNCGNSTTSFEC